jgi:hypothetical protein
MLLFKEVKFVVLSLGLDLFDKLILLPRGKNIIYFQKVQISSKNVIFPHHFAVQILNYQSKRANKD